MNPELLRAISQGGAGVIALAILIAITGVGEKPKWVIGTYHRDTVKRLEDENTRLLAERNAERELNLQLLGVTEQVVKKVRPPVLRKVSP